MSQMSRLLSIVFLSTLTLALTAMPTAAPAAFKDEWAKLLKAAQEEGKIVVFFSGPQGRAISRSALPEFEKRFGIKVIASGGSSRQQYERVKAERRVGKYTLDVWGGGATTGRAIGIPSGIIGPIVPLLFHPEVLDKSAWYGGALPLLDAERRHIFGYVGRPDTASIRYNKNLVDPNDIKSYKDRLDPKWKGKMVMTDIRVAGSATTFMVDWYFHPDLGPEFVRRLLTEMDITIETDTRRRVDWVAKGKYLISLGGGTEFRIAERQGLPIKYRFPHVLDEGASIGVAAYTIMAPTNPPHPAGQKFFINWWLSRKGQILAQHAAGDDSLRIDIPKDMVKYRRKKGKHYAFTDGDPKALQKAQEFRRFARKVLASIGK